MKFLIIALSAIALSLMTFGCEKGEFAGPNSTVEVQQTAIKAVNLKTPTEITIQPNLDLYQEVKIEPIVNTQKLNNHE